MRFFPTPDKMTRAANLHQRVKNLETGQRGFLLTWTGADECMVCVGYRHQHEPTDAFIPVIERWAKGQIKMSETKT